MIPSNSILLGQYRPHDSFLHRLDTRAKIIPVLVIMVVGLLTSSLIFYVVLLAALVVALLMSGVGSSAILRNFRPILILVAITVLYHLLFTGGDTPVAFGLFGWEVHEGALRSAGFFSMRLLLFLSAAFLITLTSSPSDLAEAVTKLLAPLKRLKVPVDDLGLILFIALRFIPILYDEFTAIRHAQMIRGVRFDGSILQRTRRSLALLIPVFVTAVGRADELANAIEARGYRRDGERTFYGTHEFGVTELLFTIVCSLSVILLYLVTG